MPNYIPGKGPDKVDLMVIVDFPRKDEEHDEDLDRLLRDCGIESNSVYITYIVKKRPPNNDLKRLSEIGHSISDWIDDLRTEIEQRNPNCILALGNLSLKTLTGKTGITDWRGSILKAHEFGGRKVVASVHPAAFLYSRGEGGMAYSMKVAVKLDYKRALEESLTSEVDLPDPNLMVCKSSQHLWNFFERYSDKLVVAIDIESHKCIPVCIGFAFSQHEAISVPLLDVMTFYNKQGYGDHELNEIWRLIAGLFAKPGLKIIGQNFKYDQAKLISPCGFDVPDPYADTMLMGHTLHPELPQSLAFLASIYTRHPYYKYEGKLFNPKKDPPERLFLYNARDCIVTFDCYLEMSEALDEDGLTDFFYDKVMPLHRFYSDLEEVGFTIDEPRRAELLEKYTALDEKACTEFSQSLDVRIASAEEQKELKKMQKRIEKGKAREGDVFYETINIGSPLQLKEFLFGVLGFPKRESTDEDTLVALLGNHCSKDDRKKRALELIMDIRKYRKTKGTYLSASADYDGRMRTSYRITGTETGRTSTSILSPPIRPINMGLAFQTLTKHGDIGAEIRSMFVPDPGTVFLEADLSQAEARIVALLAKDDDTLRLFDTTDIHKLTASRIFGIPIEEIKKESPTRFIGKTVRHAGNYGMGKRRLMAEVNTSARKYGIDISVSEWKAGQLLQAFHDFAPKIRGVYHAEVERALRNNKRTLVTPFGRKRQFLGRWDDSLIKEGLAQIPQSTVGDQTKFAGVRLRKRFPNIPIILEAHDALIAMPKIEEKDIYAKAMKEELEVPIDFERCTLKAGSIIIPVEVKIAEKNYLEFKDYKF